MLKKTSGAPKCSKVSGSTQKPQNKWSPKKLTEQVGRQTVTEQAEAPKPQSQLESPKAPEQVGRQKFTEQAEAQKNTEQAGTPKYSKGKRERLTNSQSKWGT